jgi:hypothetical protein
MNETDKCRRLVVSYGPYVVWHDSLVHRPLGLFRVYRGEHYVGGQISYPSESDCKWLDRGAMYAPAAPLHRADKQFRLYPQDKLAA